MRELGSSNPSISLVARRSTDPETINARAEDQASHLVVAAESGGWYLPPAAPAAISYRPRRMRVADAVALFMGRGRTTEDGGYDGPDISRSLEILRGSGYPGPIKSQLEEIPARWAAQGLSVALARCVTDPRDEDNPKLRRPDMTDDRLDWRALVEFTERGAAASAAADRLAPAASAAADRPAPAASTVADRPAPAASAAADQLAPAASAAADRPAPAASTAADRPAPAAPTAADQPAPAGVMSEGGTRPRGRRGRKKEMDRPEAVAARRELYRLIMVKIRRVSGSEARVSVTAICLSLATTRSGLPAFYKNRPKLSGATLRAHFAMAKSEAEAG
jgi:hypothetical protein